MIPWNNLFDIALPLSFYRTGAFPQVFQNSCPQTGNNTMQLYIFILQNQAKKFNLFLKKAYTISILE